MEKEESKESLNERSIRYSFYITYVFLLTTATITFIEAMRTSDYRIRNILNLETCISVVAAYFYGNFVKMVDEQTKKGELDEEYFKKINNTRYVDWSITTPIMLAVLCLALLYNIKGGSLKLSSFVLILFANYGMLGTGYLGEIGYFSKTKANMIGFGFFAFLYGFIYKEFLHNKYNFDNQMLYWAFVILWTFYGVFYMTDTVTRNVGYNILDLLAKCFVGIFFWAYYTKVFKL
jgi:bacteriorhodopsin